MARVVVSVFENLTTKNYAFDLLVESRSEMLRDVGGFTKPSHLLCAVTCRGDCWDFLRKAV